MAERIVSATEASVLFEGEHRGIRIVAIGQGGGSTWGLALPSEALNPSVQGETEIWEASLVRWVLENSHLGPRLANFGARDALLRIDEAKAAEITPRQFEALQWTAAGLSNEEIAKYMGITGKTVRHLLNRVFSKSEVQDRTQAVLKGIRDGFLKLDEIFENILLRKRELTREELSRKMASLSQEQRDTLEQLIQGYSNREIAENLGIHPRTVASRLPRAYRRFGLNRTALAVIFLYFTQNPEF